MTEPWNDWYHCMGHTYGTWLPGDPRGFRTRHHRLHCEGDYKSPPPPGAHVALLSRSRRLMKRAPVYLSPEACEVAAGAFAQALQSKDILTVAVSIDRVHFHALIKCLDHNPRKWIGVAKRASTQAVKAEGLFPSIPLREGLWGVRSQCVPIVDRRHQLQVAEYILRHAKNGAAVWRILKV